MDIDLQVRLAAFNWLSEQVNSHGDVLPRKLLEQGFEFQGQRIPLVAPQGIFKPQVLDLPLSITTAPKGPYDDYFGKDNFLIYSYRGTDPNHRDNVGLRKVFELKRPLVYLHGIEPGKYLATYPVYIIGDDPSNLTFKVAVDDVLPAFEYTQSSISRQIAEVSDARHAYLTSTVKVRLHQRAFREKVLDAYKSQCAVCNLKHRELLDAAHIIPDNMPEGKSTIDNGLSLCKLHHSAYDAFIIGVTPDYVIQVRADILEEEPPLSFGHLPQIRQLKLGMIIEQLNRRIWGRLVNGHFSATGHLSHENCSMPPISFQTICPKESPRLKKDCRCASCIIPLTMPLLLA